MLTGVLVLAAPPCCWLQRCWVGSRVAEVFVLCLLLRRLARASGAIVALTTGDAGLVQQHCDHFWALLNEGLVDVLFANR